MKFWPPFFATIPRLWSMDDSAVVDGIENADTKIIACSPSVKEVQLVNRGNTTRIASPDDLVQLAQHIQRADEMCRQTALNKLTVIADQIRYLQQQAAEVLKKTNRDNYLNNVKCNFVKQPGQIYYLYEHGKTGESLFSRIAPHEWGTSCPYKYVDSFKFEPDMSWTRTDENLHQKEEDLAMIEKILDSKGYCNFLTNL